MTRRRPRSALRHAAGRAGLLEPARRIRHALDDDRVRRKRRDHHVLPGVLASVLEPGDRCVDAGAHTGDVLDVLVRMAPAGDHVAFEPVPALANQLRTRFEDDDVEVREVALTDAPRQATLHYFPDHADYSGITPLAAPSAPEPVEVRTATLDDELAGGPHVQFMKMDIEGAELDALRGADAVLREHRPVVVFEHTLAAVRNGSSSAELASVLHGAGYRLFAFDGRGPLEGDEFARLVHDEGYENFIARV